jgi:hypothetical protein
MRLPPPPTLLRKQRYDRRNWLTSPMMEILSIHYGTVPEQGYPKSWQYRTLILVHRHQHLHHAYRKRYGSDWKEEIKPDLVAYTAQGRLPLDALKLGAEALREVERALWVKTRAAYLAKKYSRRPPFLAAAE